MLKKKQMLSSICDTFLKQNFDLYIKHEVKLVEHQKARAALAEGFQVEMQGLTSEINQNKEERQKLYDYNSELREKIGKAIDAYKEKEDDYKNFMAEHNKKITVVQDKLQKELKDGELGQTIKKVD